MLDSVFIISYFYSFKREVAIEPYQNVLTLQGVNRTFFDWLHWFAEVKLLTWFLLGIKT